MSNFKQTIHSLITKQMKELDFEGCDLYLCTIEGIPLFHTSENSVVDICTLSAGVWQASSAISQKMKKGSLSEFRYSFDASDEGIYILNVSISESEYLLIMTFDNAINPARHKMSLRKLRDHLFLNQNHIGVIKKDKNQDQFLFDNITDDEMDKLFAQVGR